VKTFLLDVHGGALRSGPAAPLLYPLQAADELQVFGPAGPKAGSTDLGDLADRVRIALLRQPVQRWLALFLIELDAGEGTGRSASLVEPLERIRSEFLGPLAAVGLAPARVVVLAADGLAREPHTGAPFDSGGHRTSGHSPRALLSSRKKSRSCASRCAAIRNPRSSTTSSTSPTCCSR
jgi:hypothetical protein